MSRKRHSAEEVINKLRQADVELGKGNTVAGVCKLLSVTEPTYFRWRKQHGGLKVDQARRFKELEQENTRPAKSARRPTISPSMTSRIYRRALRP